MNDDLQWPYWSVDLPGMTEASAARVLAFVEREGLALGGSLVDPAESFSAHIDRDTAEALIEALRAVIVRAELEPEHKRIVRGFLDILEEWSVR